MGQGGGDGGMAMTDGPGMAEPPTLRVMMVARLFHPWVGGSERQAHALAKALIALGVDVQVVTGWWFRGTARREVLDGVPVFRNQTLWEMLSIRGMRKLGGYLYILSLSRHLRRRRHSYDIIHVHGLNYHAAAAASAGRRLGKPVVVKLANSGPASDITKMREDRQLALARYMLPAALASDRFVALNTRIVDELRDAGVPRERIVELPNGVDADGRVVRRSHALHDPPCLIYVGRLHEQKGLDSLLHAHRELVAAGGPQVPLLRLVGDGPMRQILETEAERLGLSSHVEFAGICDDVPAELARADVFVLPSRAEGLSNALLEAMASALAVVVSDIPGNRDVVEHGRNGLLAPIDDAASLAARLRELLGDDELRHRLGVEARCTVEEGYSLGAVAGRYVALYRELLGQTGTVQAGPARGERAL